MKRILAPFIILTFLCACQEPKDQVITAEPELSAEIDTIFEEPFKLALGIGYDQGIPWLNADLELADSSWIVSPFSEDDFYMPFTLTIEESDDVKLAGTLKERPPSIQEFDEIIEKEVSLVTGNTIFSHKLEVTATEAFKVKGKIEFMLEPLCVPYTVEFVISDDYEMVTVTKTGTWAGIAKN
jgi:hypothetical protein